MKLKFIMTLLAASFTALASASPVGHWIDDPDSLPAFALTAKLPTTTTDAAGHPLPVRNDPIFLLGNYRLTLFVHGSGLYQVVTGERLWARINAAGNSSGANRTKLIVRRSGRDTTYNLVGLDSVADDPALCRRTFGTGFATFEYSLPDLAVTRTISVAPSEHVDQGQPGFVVSMTFHNTGESAVELSLDESVLAHFETMTERLIPESARLVQYQYHTSVDQAETSVRCDLHPTSADPTILVGRHKASCYESFPPSLVFLGLSHASPGEKSEMYTEAGQSGGEFLGQRFSLPLAPGKSRTLHWVISLEPKPGENETRILADKVDPAATAPFFRKDWVRALPALRDEKDPLWRREMTWHAYVLEAMATYNEFYGETYIPQGQTYDYEMGLTAAPRDHLQHALAVCYTDPALAKSCLRYVLKKMTNLGEIPYTTNGLGHVSNSAWNTSDQQLYLFLAVGEYLRITHNYAFLDDTSEFLPLEAHYTGTTLEKLERAFGYLRDEVGKGPHGLVRLMNSDWSDMIYSDTPVFRYFWTAESHMNSAMVLAVFPNLIAQLEVSSRVAGADHDRIVRLADGLRHYLDAMRVAFYKDLGDRTFSRRLYFDGKTSWGDDNMHIEPQSYLMQAPDFPRARKLRLWQEVQARIMKGEQIGPRQREVPLRGAMYEAGTGENGGVWYALVGPMIVGVGTVDPQAGWAMLRRASMDNYAKNFPDDWVGQWTAPECLNSVITGPMAGLPRTGNDWIWMSFPVYCAHPHAWSLYCYYRLKELSQ
ncbi:MAG TPA: hypothetical protein VGM64_19265 [Lacunisphaera sp.]|jgi:cellobiose phosphorylase